MTTAARTTGNAIADSYRQAVRHCLESQIPSERWNLPASVAGWAKKLDATKERLAGASTVTIDDYAALLGGDEAGKYNMERMRSLDPLTLGFGALAEADALWNDHRLLCAAMLGVTTAIYDCKSREAEKSTA